MNVSFLSPWLDYHLKLVDDAKQFVNLYIKPLGSTRYCVSLLTLKRVGLATNDRHVSDPQRQSLSVSAECSVYPVKNIQEWLTLPDSSFVEALTGVREILTRMCQEDNEVVRSLQAN